MLAEDPTFKVSEIFSSIQGEGVSAGQACLFVRLAHCNLSCQWCDTPYSWDFRSYDFLSEVSEVAVTALAATINAKSQRRLVVTGGEPLIQQALLAQLFDLLPGGLAIEIETNGTLFPSAELLARVDQWNVSPKLDNSRQPLSKRWRPEVLRAFAESERAWLKLVVASDQDCLEALALLEQLPFAFPKERILFMPLSRDAAELRRTAPGVARASVRHGTGYSPRLHLELFDGERGR